MAKKADVPATVVGAGALSPISVLNVQPVVLHDQLYVEPGLGAATEILTAFAGIVIPLKLGVLDIPVQLLNILDEQAQVNEQILPISVAKNIVILRKLRGLLNGTVTEDGENFLDCLIPEAVAQANNNVAKMIRILKEYISSMDALKSQYGADKYFLAKAASATQKIDEAAIRTIMLDTIGSFNTLSAGMNGYYMLSAVNVVAQIANLLNETDLQIAGCPSKAAILNKLGFKVTPLHASANTTLAEFFTLLKLVEAATMDNTKCLTVMDNSTRLKHAVDLLESAGKK